MSEQEHQARELYKRLVEIFAKFTDTNISIGEPGLHWNCSINRKERYCVIHCFGKKGFAVSFRIYDAAKARGRTQSENELISSVVSWLKGDSLTEMHDLFEFIDRGKRYLEKFLDKAIALYPELELSANILIEPAFSESFCLRFITAERYCKIYFSDQRQYPTCEFYWKDFHIFEFYIEDISDTSLILKRWFCDNVMPSVLAQEFPRLNTGNLSLYLNLDRVIEFEFMRSWDGIEKFYPFIYAQIPNISSIMKLVAQMRQQGFDKTLRAGMIVSMLCLSRSLHHGLRKGQSYLIFQFDSNGLKIFNSSMRDMVLYSPRIELSPQIKILLKQLESCNID